MSGGGGGRGGDGGGAAVAPDVDSGGQGGRGRLVQLVLGVVAVDAANKIVVALSVPVHYKRETGNVVHSSNSNTYTIRTNVCSLTALVPPGCRQRWIDCGRRGRGRDRGRGHHVHGGRGLAVGAVDRGGRNGHLLRTSAA